MKRYRIRLFSIAIGIIFLAGCKPTDWEPTTFDSINNLEGVSMVALEGSITNTGMTIHFENETENDYIYGSSFSLKKNIEDDWYQVPIIVVDYAFDDIGHELPASDSREWTVDWEWLYGELDSGKYRIVKDVLNVREPGDYDTYYLAEEFTIE